MQEGAHRVCVFVVGVVCVVVVVMPCGWCGCCCRLCCCGVGRGVVTVAVWDVSVAVVALLSLLMLIGRRRCCRGCCRCCVVVVAVASAVVCCCCNHCLSHQCQGSALFVDTSPLNFKLLVVCFACVICRLPRCLATSEDDFQEMWDW